MHPLRVVLAASLLAAALPLRAQNAAPKPAAPAQPALHCPCDAYGFEPLNDKARAAAEFWDARRDYRVASAVASGFFLLALAVRDLKTLNESDQAYHQAQVAFSVAVDKALRVGAIKRTGPDARHDVEFLIKPGVDYIRR